MEEEAIRGYLQYNPSSSSPPLQYDRGFIALGSRNHSPPASMGAWPRGDSGSTNNGLEFTDLTMSLEGREEEDEEPAEGDDAGKAAAEVEKEHMFDKVVTPSDVGKLNRLVIPKQHAERFFPLDSSASEKGGLLLSFEDRNGKPWRFRYSYWNSSQSYVMTKGWSRFVKEKKLDAGDIVSFQRGIGDKDRLFIDWRHKPVARHQDIPMSISYPGTVPIPHSFSFHRPAAAGVWNINYPSNFPRDHHHHHHMAYTAISETSLHPSRTNIYGNVMMNNSAFGDSSVVYLRPGAAAQASTGGAGNSIYRGGIEHPVVFESVPLVQGAKVVMAAPPTKRQLRLFGVNMDCSTSESNEHEAPQVNPSSSSQSTQDPQLSVYNGMPVPSGWLDKGKASAPSLDFGI